MHPVNLIASAILTSSDLETPEIPSKRFSGVCCITGEKTECVKRSDLFGKSFTDGAILKAPESELASLDAFVALKYKWERMSSWICTGKEFKRLDRVGVRDAVFGELPKEPWTAYATTSYKKHGALRSVINKGSKNVWLFESRIVDCDGKEEYWERLNFMLRRGFGRTILESLDCPGPFIAKYGIKEWIDFEKWARPRYKNSLYAFMCYLLPSQEELKNEKEDDKTQRVSECETKSQMELF